MSSFIYGGSATGFNGPVNLNAPGDKNVKCTGIGKTTLSALLCVVLLVKDL